MNMNQTVIAHIAKEAAGELIGGLENTLLDYPEESTEYQDAYRDLHAGHDSLVSWIVSDVKTVREAHKHLKFAGNAFLIDYVSRLLTRWGY